MEQLGGHDASSALRLLANAAVERGNELQQYDPNPRSQSDEEESDAPILNAFLEEGGGAAVMQMTNFDVLEFHAIWEKLRDFVSENWNVGRGRRSTFKPKDVLFMLLTVCKHGGLWDYNGKMFKIKGPSFERLITGFLSTISDHVYDKMVVLASRNWPMSKLISTNSLFKTFKMARYATDVTFQQANRPSGNMEEGKKYYSGKHKLYGYKVEVSVMPNGFSIGCSKHFPGSVADIDIFSGMQPFHRKQSKKSTVDSEVADVGPLVEEYPTTWAILLDKGYQGAAEFVRAIHPKKKPLNGSLSPGDERYNKKVSSDRIIVENYFGRLCSLWGVVSSKYRWAEKHYDTLFRFCLGVTNIHIKWHPLRQNDFEHYHRVLNRIYGIGTQRVEKRKRVQERYRMKRKMRMAVQFREPQAPDDDLDHDETNEFGNE